VNIIVPVKYPGYDMASFTVSELSAIDTPTRQLWILLCIPYTLFLFTFGMGVWLTSGQNKLLRILAIFLIIDAVFGAYWPPMHQRQVIAADGGTLTDTLHLVWAGITLLLFLIIMTLGAMALSKAFRWYTAVTLLVFIVFGYLTSTEAPGISEGQPTPHLGIWERVNMGAHMLWVAVLSMVLLKKYNSRGSHRFLY
jgi:hypothetical protein